MNECVIMGDWVNERGGKDFLFLQWLCIFQTRATKKKEEDEEINTKTRNMRCIKVSQGGGGATKL